mgnify:CR=1 FL=1
MRKLPLGVLNLATADRYHIARIVLVLIRQPHNPLVALRKHIRTWARAKRHADKQTEHSEYKEYGGKIRCSTEAHDSRTAVHAHQDNRVEPRIAGEKISPRCPDKTGRTETTTN